ncbi:hypothetical protein MCEMKE14_00754 [Candidatus Nanopelagicaceae bacterium]
MRNRSVLVIAVLLLTSLAVPGISKAAGIMLPPLSNFELIGTTLKFDALVSNCLLSEPTSSFFGSSITPASTQNEIADLAFQENGSGSKKTTTTLVVNIAFPFNPSDPSDSSCKWSETLSKKYSLALPENLTFKYIYDQYTQTFIFPASAELPQPKAEVPSSSDEPILGEPTTDSSVKNEPSSSEAPVLSGPTSNMPLEFSNPKVSGDVLTFEADLPECAINEPAIRYFSALIDPESSPAKINDPELLALGKNTSIVKTLVILLTVPVYTECKYGKSKKETFKITLPKLKYFQFIFDLAHKKFIFENQASSPTTAKPPIAISFVANRNLAGGSDAGSELIEVKIGTDGIPVINTLANVPGVHYQIKAIAKNGLIVTAYDHRTKKYPSNTYLVSNTKWTLLSTKTIFVEPAVVSTDLKTLYGRRVKDAANSTVIFAQNLKTGNTPSYFDAAKHGGGFICGVVADPTFKFGYFTHLTKKSTDIYQIDLGNGKMKKLGTTTAGACIDATNSNGDFIAKFMNPTSLETQEGDLIVISKKNPKSYRHIEIRETFMHTGMHSLIPFGDYVLGWNSTYDLHLVGLAKNEGFSFDILDPETLAGPEPLHFLQYICNLPLTWQSDTKRPNYSIAKY